MSGLIPNTFWFRLALHCPRVDAVTADRFDEDWSLPESARLPDSPSLLGAPGWAELRLGWNPEGLALQVIASGRTPCAPPAETFRFWIDTRDTRDVHRATRFCHRFGVAIDAPRVGPAVSVVVGQKPIARALLDAPTAPRAAIKAKAARQADGWSLWLFVSAEALYGFDPESNRRLGLTTQVVDPHGKDQFLGPGAEFPVGEDPSLWSPLELQDAPIAPPPTPPTARPKKRAKG